MVENPLDNYSTQAAVLYSLVAVGALNWGLMAAFDVNLVMDYASGQSDLIYAVIGAAGAVNLTELFGITDFLED
jgi:uncharacterized membrane protein YuzA (DUF378 family)